MHVNPSESNFVSIITDNFNTCLILYNIYKSKIFQDSYLITRTSKTIYVLYETRQVSVCFSKHIHRESGVNQFNKEREREQLEDSRRKIQIRRKRRGGERGRDEGIGNGRGKKRRDVEIIVPEGSTNRRYTRHPR